MALPQSVLDKIHRDTEERRISYQQKVSSYEKQQAERQEQRIATAPAGPRNDMQGNGAGQTLMELATSGSQPGAKKMNFPMYQNRLDGNREYISSQKLVPQRPEENALAQWQYQAKKQDDSMSSTGIQAQLDSVNQQIDTLMKQERVWQDAQYSKSVGMEYLGGDVPEASVQDQIDQLVAQRGNLEAQLEQTKTREWYDQQKEQILTAGGEELLSKLREYDRAKKGKAEMSNEEVSAMLSDLSANGYSYEQIMEMVDFAARLNSDETYDAAMEKSAQLAADHPVLASVSSVAGSLTSGFGMIDVADQNLRNLMSGKDTPVNYKTTLMVPSGATNTIRGQVASDIEAGTEGWVGSDTAFGNLYSNSYQLAMSMADSLGVVGLTAMGVPYAGVLLGGSAATSAMTEAKERGATDAQALTMGLLSGVAETLFEQVSIDSLFSLDTPASVKDALKNILKQAIPEASEELNTTIANTVADMLVMGDKSQYETEKRRYMAQGMTAQEAAKKAGKDWFNGLMSDAIGGFISGGLFGAGSNAVNSFQNSRLNAAIQETLKPTAQSSRGSANLDAAFQEIFDDSSEQRNQNAERVQEAVQDAIGQNKPAQADTGAESTKVNTDPAVHTPQEQAVIEEYQGAVDQGLVQFAENVANGNIPSNKARYTLNPVTERAASDIQQITGVDTHGFSTVIESRMVDHILKRHGKNGSADHSMQDLNDLGRIQYVINNYDRISDGGTSKAYTTIKENGKSGNAKTVVFEKAVNGTYYVIEAVPDTKAKTTFVVSAYMSKNGYKNTGAGQLTDASKNTPVFTSENGFAQTPAEFNVAQTSQNVNGNQGQDGVLPETAVGAMKSDPQSFSYFQNQTDQFYPEGPNAARPVDMPKTGPTGRPVRRFANNAYGAQIMTDENVTGLEQDFMDGKLEYDVVTDQAALERAKNTVAQDGYDRAFAQTVERLQSIKDMKNTSATAQVLINQAIQEGRQEDAGVLLALMEATGTELGQGLQSYSMFRKLTPEGQLAGIQSVADRIDQQISEKNGVSSETKSQTLKAVNDVRETALRLLQNIRQAFGEGYQKNHGVPVEDWTTEIGNRLAKALEQRSGTRTPTTAQTIKNDLLRFAKGWVHQDQSTRTPRTSVDTLRDYFANRDAYNEAWNQARNVLSEKYKSNPQMLDSLDEFLTATIDYNGGTDSSVMLKAITEEAIAQELKDKNIQIRSFFGDHDAIENQISDALIRKTGAEGTDAGLIRAAVNRYITEQVNASETKTADVIDKDIRAMVGKIGEDISQIIRSSPGEKSEIASDIADLLTKQYGVSAENAASTASYIVQQFNEYVAEKSEAELRKRFGAKKKNLQKSFEQNFTELANMGAFTGSRYQSTVTEKLFGHAVTIDQGLIQEFLNASDQDARNEVMTKIYKDIAAQVPATFTDKWNAWRYLSMLGNPRTHVRNILGNAMFAPVRGVKNQMGAVMEAVAEKAGWIDKSQRTKSVGFNWSQEDRARMAAAKADYANAEELILSGGKYNSATSTIEQNRRIFNNAVLETLRKGNSTALDVEDTWFSKPAYASSLAGYLKAQGFTAEDFTGSGMTDAQKDKARSYAIKEAQKATYRDVNAFSDMVSSIGFKNANSRWKKGVNTLIEGVMPFKRTPANILARGMEYSPAGLAKALTVDIVQVANGKLTAAEYMDHLASGLTGTGLFALGYLLSNMGLLTGGSPEDEDQADLEGRQPYALEIGGTSVTLDWLAPEALPVFMGVELSEAIQESAGKTVTMDSLKSFFNGLTGPVLEMSMMSSLQDALEATTYADNKIMSFLANAALGYVGQAFPTLFGQLERTVSGKIRETTFTQKTGFLDTDTQYALGNVANKIPFWDFSQVPYIDAWGRTQENGNMGARAFNNLLNPAYVSKINETPVDREIKRLEQATGANLTPSRADKKLTINNKTILLTKDEYVTYATAKGQNDYTLRENLLNAEAYQGLDDDVKVKAMEYARSYADELARQEAGIQDVHTSWMQELAEADADTVTQALVAKAVESVLPTVSAGKYTSLADMVENNKIDDAMALSLCSESLQESYYSGPSEAGITVQQWLDTYGYATSHAEPNDNESKRAAAVEYANSLDISNEQRTALVNGMYSVMTDYIPKDVQPSNEFLLSQGQAGIATIEANMSESQKERYETYIKKTGVDMETYLKVYEFKGNAHSDYDEDGNETKSAMEKVVEFIDKNGKTRKDKRNLFLSMGYSEKNLPYQWR